MNPESQLADEVDEECRYVAVITGVPAVPAPDLGYSNMILSLRTRAHMVPYPSNIAPLRFSPSDDGS